MITENISTLKMHKLTQEQYNREFINGNIDEKAIYLVPEEERVGNLSDLKTNDKTSIVDAINELTNAINGLYDLINSLSNS